MHDGLTSSPMLRLSIILYMIDYCKQLTTDTQHVATSVHLFTHTIATQHFVLVFQYYLSVALLIMLIGLRLGVSVVISLTTATLLKNVNTSIH